MGGGDSHFTSTEKTNGACSMCKIMTRLFNPEKDSDFCIQCGDLKGKKMTFRRAEEGSGMFLENSQEVRKILIGCPEDDTCINSVRVIEYLGGDKGTVNTLISWILYDKLYKHRTVLNLYSTFNCNWNIVTIEEKPDYNTLKELAVDYPIDATLCKGILMQLTASMDKIQSSILNFNRVSMKNICFKKRSNNYNYGDLEISCLVTAKLRGFDYSSINHKGKRIFHNADHNRIFTHQRTLVPRIITKNIKMKSGKELSLFKFTDEAVKLFYYDEINGPLMPSAINTYIIWVALMSEESFYNAVMSDALLSNIWWEMWVGTKSFTKVNEATKKLHKGPENNYINILEVMVGAFMRCDVSEYIIDKVVESQG
jgi:hypothetical protein